MGFFSKKSDDKRTSQEVAKHVTLGRNDPCHCGSGKKYKKCCMAKDEAADRKTLEEQWAKSAAAAKDQEEKKAKDAPPTPTKNSANPQTAGKHHPTIVPHQVSMPRRSGGG
jgi:hypothetical protein